MAKNSAQAPTEKPEAQKGSAAKMPLFSTKFDGSGSDNTDEFRRTLSGHLELLGVLLQSQEDHPPDEAPAVRRGLPAAPDLQRSVITKCFSKYIHRYVVH